MRTKFIQVISDDVPTLINIDHIATVELQDEQTVIRLINGDFFDVSETYDEMKKLLGNPPDVNSDFS